jgi:hypothetical protein
MTRTRIGPILVLASLLLQAGCSGKSAPPPSEEEVNLKKLAILIGQFRAHNRGALPTDPAQVKAFAAQMPADRLQGWHIDPGNLDALLISSRDLKPFVFRAPAAGGGPPTPGGPQRVMVYEQVGKDGKRMVAYETCQVAELDEAKFKELVPEAR